MTPEALIKLKIDQPGPLSRVDIADVLLSIGPAGQLRAEKQAAVKELCEQKLGQHGIGFGGHPIWTTLEDWVQY